MYSKKTIKPFCYIGFYLIILCTSPLTDNNSFANEIIIHNPQNGHYYQRIEIQKTWNDAKDYCEKLGGYLATITSELENQIVYKELVKVSKTNCWLGGTDGLSEGTWEWVTGEKWSYSNWDGGEPNNGFGRGQDNLQMYTRSGKWDDAGPPYHNNLLYFICEWDTNRIFNPSNGHYYQRVEIKKTWEDSKIYCQNLGGHLATITSEEENEFVFNELVKNSKTSCWLGGNDIQQEGTWEWITGENWVYSNWQAGEPNNGLGRGQHNLHMYNRSGTWDDAGPPYHNEFLFFICEWGTDNYYCNNYDSDKDGVIDQWDKCPKTPLNSYVNRYGCPANENSAISGRITIQGKPMTQGTATLIQSGEIFQKSPLDINGSFKFDRLSEEKSINIMIRKPVE